MLAVIQRVIVVNNYALLSNARPNQLQLNELILLSGNIKKLAISFLGIDLFNSLRENFCGKQVKLVQIIILHN